MEASGIKVVQRIMEDDEYIKRLKDKLMEETQEVLEAQHPKEMQEELADVIEVVKALGQIHGVTFEEVLQTAAYKQDKKGGFDRKIYVEKVELPPDHPSLSYYETNSDRYLEVTPISNLAYKDDV